MKTVELTINGKRVTAPAKATIIEAAIDNGIYIPRLCWDRRLKPFGGCRLCLVEWEGNSKLFAACSTPVRQDMVINTESEKLARARKVVLELLLVHHPLDCPVCDKAGECELQDLAYKYGPDKSRFKGKRKHGPELLAAPLLERNPNRCILCGKCVRICTEHQGVGAISFIGRGFDTIISPAFEETLDCEFCGQCIDACPVGALGSKPYRFRSRVWMMKEQDTICPYCGCGCTVRLGIRDGRIVRSVAPEGVGISKGDLCGKGRFGFDYVTSEKRLKSPLIRKGKDLVEATWEEALKFIADKLSAIKSKDGADAIGAIGSQRCSLEDNFMLQKLMRDVVGTGNIDSIAAFGYARSIKAVKKAFGLDTLPMSFDSPIGSDVILVVDSDLTSTHPVFGLNIMSAARDHGANLIVIEPKVTKLARHSTEWLRSKAASAVAVLNGMMKVIIDENLHNKSAESVQKFADLKASLQDYTLEQAQQLSGVSAERIAEAARAFAKARKPLVCMSLGDTENNKGMNTVLAAANLLILVGAGPDALQIPADLSNTLGMYEAGVRPDAGPGHSKLDKQGLGLYEMLYAGASRIKALYIMGENPLVSFPDLDTVKKRLSELDLLVVQDIIMTDTAQMAHVVLPGASWSEKDGTFVGATGIPQVARKLLSDTGSARPDWQILMELARVMLADPKYLGQEAMKAELSRKVKLDFTTSGATAAFNPVAADIEGGDQDYPFSMVVGTLMQHSGSLTSLSKHLGSVVSDAFLQMNNKDADKFGIKDETYVRISSKKGELLLKAKVTDEVPSGMLFAPAHFPHAKLNSLTTPATNGNANVVAVKIEKA